MSDILQRVRSANPIFGHDDVDPAEFELALAEIEDRWEFGNESPRIPGARRPGWVRPALVAAGAALLVILAIATPILLLRGEEQPVTDTTLPPATTTSLTPTTTLPVTTTTPTTIPPPTPTAPAMTWTRLPDDPMFDSTAIWTITAGGPGLVAAGGSHTDDGMMVNAIVWTSSDGVTWERIDDPSFSSGIPPAEISYENPGAGIGDVAAGPLGVVGVGFNGHGAAVWTSPDGIEWSPTDDADLLGGGFSSILGVTAGGPGWVAVGEVDMDGGVWVSEDGLDWVQVEDDALLAGDRIDVSIYDVATWNGGLIAVGSVGLWDGSDERAIRGAVWASRDGLEWRELDGDSFKEQKTFERVAVDPSTGAVLAFGWAGISKSLGGEDWILVPKDEAVGGPPPGSGVGWSGDHVVAGGPDMALSLWVSDDSGGTWHRVDPNDQSFEGYNPGVDDVVLFGDRFVVVGAAGDYLQEVGAIWIGTWDE